MENKKQDTASALKDIIAHAKEYGFVFPSSEIYDGLQAVYDYGQNGVELKNNLKTVWWKAMTMLNDNVVGIDAAIFMHPLTWKASGHVDSFNDPMIDNKDSKKRYRADTLLEDKAAQYDAEGNETKGKALLQQMAKCLDAGNLEGVRQLIIDEKIVKDPLSYNVSYGGKHYLHGLKTYDPNAFVVHQRSAGKKGGPAAYKKKTTKEKIKWHSKGGKAAAEKHKKNGTHPFYNGTAASAGGKALTGMVELWNPNSTATNKNQITYKPGDCKRVFPNTKKFDELVNHGWSSIDKHKTKISERNL